MGFFSQLLDVLFPPKDTERIVRETSEVAFTALITPTMMRSGVTFLLPYRHRMVRAAILEAKFKRNKKAIQLLSMALGDYLAALQEDSSTLAPQEFSIVPIPLGSKRQRERGYNQVEEVANASGVRIEKVLTRMRDTVAQTTLSRRQRLTNMTGAFTVSGLNTARTYIILDDVMTTGATLEAAQTALIEAGLGKPLLLALAH